MISRQYTSTSELCGRYGRSPRTLHRWQKTRGFPKPIAKAGNGSECRWRESDIREWEDAQAAQ